MAQWDVKLKLTAPDHESKEYITRWINSVFCGVEIIEIKQEEQ